MATKESQKNQVIPLPKPTELEIREHQQLLGTGKLPYTIPHLLSCYEAKLWAVEENNEWTHLIYKKFTHAKFALLRNLVLEQVKEDGRFKIESNFENPCNKCGGTGEIYKFVRKTQTVKCMKCVKGKTPDGSDCQTCRGSGEVKTYAIIPVLRDTTTCSYCKGKGFFKKKQIYNPAIDEKAAKKIKKKLQDTVVEKETPTNLGAEVKSATVPDPVAPHMIDTSQDKILGEGTSKKIKQPPVE